MKASRSSAKLCGCRSATGAENPVAEPKNSVSQGTKSVVDSPCR